jgi:hypothetical protein
LKKYDALTVSSEKKTFFNMILDSGELTKADVEKIITHADSIDIS